MYYQCKHCSRPVHDYTTEGINDWMSQAVVLLSDETRLVGELDTEHAHRVGGRKVEADGTKWLHKVCWEAAGRPEYDAYETPSKHLSEDGYIDRKTLWVITPEVTDPAEREQLLADGEAAYEARMFDRMACDLDNLIETNPEYMDEEEREFPYRQLFRVSAWSGNVGITDRLRNDYIDFDGTKEEAEAKCKELYEVFMASDQHAALVARRAELNAKWRAEHMAKLKEEGRYEVSYRPSRKGGDWINGKQCGRTMFYVKDKLEYDTVAEFDFSDEMAPKKYEAPDSDEYDGNHSAEWEARVEAFRAETGRIRDLADAECDRLNKEWAAAGYPGRKEDSDAD
jgi:hypothetical protein